jgi:D-hexose-6-phosphate mutarotase
MSRGEDIVYVDRRWGVRSVHSSAAVRGGIPIVAASPGGYRSTTLARVDPAKLNGSRGDHAPRATDVALSLPSEQDRSPENGRGVETDPEVAAGLRAEHVRRGPSPIQLKTRRGKNARGPAG